jgi:hypothetical protein
MASIGFYADLLSAELGRARGSILAEVNELRRSGDVPTGARGVNAPDLPIRAVVKVLVSSCLNPEAGNVAQAVNRILALPRNDAASRLVGFKGLSVETAITFGDTLGSILTDAVEGRLQRWKTTLAPCDLFFDFVDGGEYVELTASRATGEPGMRRDSTVVFARKGIVQGAPSAFRIFRLDSRILERLAPLLAPCHTQKLAEALNS